MMLLVWIFALLFLSIGVCCCCCFRLQFSFSVVYISSLFQLVTVPLAFLENSMKNYIFSGYFTNWVCLKFSHTLAEVTFFGKNTGRRVPFSVQHIGEHISSLV